jgi:hypothetical protein
MRAPACSALLLVAQMRVMQSAVWNFNPARHVTVRVEKQTKINYSISG